MERVLQNHSLIGCSLRSSVLPVESIEVKDQQKCRLAISRVRIPVAHLRSIRTAPTRHTICFSYAKTGLSVNGKAEAGAAGQAALLPRILVNVLGKNFLVPRRKRCRFWKTSSMRPQGRDSIARTCISIALVHLMTYAIQR